MALSPEEQQELAQLEAKYAPKKKGLSPLEEKELQDLEAKYGKAPAQEKSWYDVSGKGLVRGAVDSLPVMGAMAGGAVGTFGAGPVGGIAGAGMGGVAGESLKKFIDRYFYDAPPETRQKLYSDLASAGTMSAVGEGAGQLIAGPIAQSFMRSGVQDIAQSGARPGAEAIRTAAQSLNVKPTNGMLTDDYITRNLENSISQNPSIPGSMIRNEYKPIKEAINEASEKALTPASTKSPVQAGKDMRAQVAKTFEDKFTPIQQSYKEIESHTSNIPLNPKGLNRISKNIRTLEDAKFKGSEANGIANQFADWLDEAKSVNDIKILKTKARQLAENPSASPEARSVASSIWKKLDQAQTNSITRQAVKIAREGKITSDASGRFLNKAGRKAADAEAQAEGLDVGRRLIGDIKKTNKAYKQVMNEAKTFGEGSGVTKAKYGPKSIVEDIKRSNPQEMASALFDSGNMEYTQWVQKNMPKEFEMARQSRLAEVAQKSVAPDGSISPKKLQALVNKMTPEEFEILFPGDVGKKLRDAGVLLKSLPEKVGASDTPRGLSFQDLGLKQNVIDFGRYGLLKTKRMSPAVGRTIRGAKPYYQGLINNGLLDDNE